MDEISDDGSLFGDIGFLFDDVGCLFDDVVVAAVGNLHSLGSDYNTIEICDRFSS